MSPEFNRQVDKLPFSMAFITTKEDRALEDLETGISIIYPEREGTDLSEYSLLTRESLLDENVVKALGDLFPSSNINKAVSFKIRENWFAWGFLSGDVKALTFELRQESI